MNGNTRHALLMIVCLALVLLCAPATMAHQGAKSTATEKSHFATLDGARIHYQSYGKGREALVLIHGWTCNLDYWRDQAPDFAKRNRVIALAILAKSPFSPADTEQFLRSLAPKLEFQMWEGVGHFLMMEKPKQFNDAVISFLNQNSLLK